MAQLFTNNATSTLAAGVTNVASTLTVAGGDGAKFPSPTPPDFFYATIYQVSGTLEVNWEVVKVTSRSSDVFTVTRAQDNTTAKAFNTGDKIELRWVSANIGNLLDKNNNLSDLTNVSVARSNLGLGSAALSASGDFATSTQGTKADGALQKSGGTMSGQHQLAGSSVNTFNTVPARADASLLFHNVGPSDWSGMGSYSGHELWALSLTGFQLWAASSTVPVHSILSNGYTGINKATPTVAMDVNGDLKANNIGYITEVNHGNFGGAFSVDFSTAACHSGALNANCTFSFVRPAVDGTYRLFLRLQQDGSGNRTVTWPAVTWAGGSAPYVGLSPNQCTLVSFYCVVVSGVPYYYGSATVF